MKYYSTNEIDAKKSTYNVIFGERSNGKTYQLLKKSLIAWVKNKTQTAYVRRWKEDITGRRAARLYSSMVENKEVSKITNNEFQGIHYWAGKWYLCNYEKSGKAIYNDRNILCFSFALSDGEHDKSTSFPNIYLIIFDEFITNRVYLNDEFILFMNTISTIVRRREGIKIYMLGNTVNKYCPYFSEMGLTNISKMIQGSIDVYNYGDSSLTVSVEYCKSSKQTKEVTNKYFAFNNPKLHMITGGAWELNMYPHLPIKYTPRNILLIFFIEFSECIYQCEVVNAEEEFFIFIHSKTTPIKKNDDLVYSLDFNVKINYVRNIFKPINKTQTKILWFFSNHKVFYQNNNIGDAINNYLKICKKI